MPVVKFTRNLQRYYPALQPISSEGSTLAHVLQDIEQAYPGICGYILDEQRHIRKHVQVFIDNEALVFRDNLEISLKPSDEIYIMQALSGG